MTIQEGLGILKMLFPQHHSTVVEEAVYYGGVDREVRNHFKAYLAQLAGWSIDCETVEEAIKDVVIKAIREEEGPF